jgi:hypothetical protein
MMTHYIGGVLPLKKKLLVVFQLEHMGFFLSKMEHMGFYSLQDVTIDNRGVY